MPEIRVKIPELGGKLEREIIRGIKISARAEIARVLLLKKWDKMLSKSELTEKESIKLGRELKKSRFERLRNMGLV